MNRDNRELITKKDYQILGIKENSTPDEINSAYEKLCLEYHPEKIKKAKLREATELELKKFQEIEKVYKKFDIEHKEYICYGIKDGVKLCLNEFYPALWIKEEGEKKYFCSQECYNSKWKSDELVEKWEKEDKEALEKSLTKLKFELSEKLEKARKKSGIEVTDLEPQNRNFFTEINNVNLKENANLRDNKSRVSENLINETYSIYNRVKEDIESKSKSKEKKENKKYCDNCRQEIKEYKDENGHIVSGVGSVDQDGNQHKFCSEECSEKFRGWSKTVIRKNAFAELLKWMEKEGITNIGLDPDSGKLVIEYDKNNSQTIEDGKLTSEQAEIKKFFQQIGKNSLSQSQVREELARERKSGDNNVGPAIAIVVTLLIITLIGVIIYKNKKKDY